MFLPINANITQFYACEENFSTNKIYKYQDSL